MKRQSMLTRNILLFLLILTLAACGSTNATAPAKPNTDANQPNTGPKGLPLYCPRAVTIDRQDNIYVADNDDSSVHERVIELSSVGQVLDEWHLFPAQNIGIAQGPEGIALDAQNNMYIIDNSRNRILKVSPAGKILAQWGSVGNNPGQIADLSQAVIVVDSQQNVYVSDGNASRIDKFTSNGAFVSILKLKNIKTTINGVSFSGDPYIHGLAVGKDDTLYVAGDDRVMSYSVQGKELHEWPLNVAAGTDAALFLSALALDRQGNLEVAAFLSVGSHMYPRVIKISPTGQILGTWSGLPEGIIWSIAVDSQGNVYTVNKTAQGAELDQYAPSGKSLAAWKASCD